MQVGELDRGAHPAHRRVEPPILPVVDVARETSGVAAAFAVILALEWYGSSSVSILSRSATSSQ